MLKIVLTTKRVFLGLADILYESLYRKERAAPIHLLGEPRPLPPRAVASKLALSVLVVTCGAVALGAAVPSVAEGLRPLGASGLLVLCGFACAAFLGWAGFRLARGSWRLLKAAHLRGLEIEQGGRVPAWRRP